MKLKDKKIEILETIHTVDEAGFGTTTYTPIASPVWAYYRQLSGKEIYANMSVQAVEASSSRYSKLMVVNYFDFADLKGVQ